MRSNVSFARKEPSEDAAKLVVCVLMAAGYLGIRRHTLQLRNGFNRRGECGLRFCDFDVFFVCLIRRGAVLEVLRSKHAPVQMQGTHSVLRGVR